MSNPMFRDLRADEIEVRVAQATKKGVSLLLYKDARCDQNILDETVGAMNWQRSHSRDNANCTVSIWDKEKSQWVGKEDTGTESNTEKEKGLASDSFKRACFNWGIGRELYTAPFTWVDASNCEKLEEVDDGRKKKWVCKDRFSVSSITIENKRITALTISNARGKTVFTMGKNSSTTFGGNDAPPPAQKQAPKSGKQPSYRDQLIARLNELNIDVKAYSAANNLNGCKDPERFRQCLEDLNNG